MKSKFQRRSSSAVSASLIAIAVSAVAMQAGAQTRPAPEFVPAAKIKTGAAATLEMCATLAYRKKNEMSCSSAEQSVKLQASNSSRASAPPSTSIPSTSPNYGRDGKAR
jgi:hypothetical protein